MKRMILAVLLSACASAPPPTPTAPAKAGAKELAAKPFPLPGATGPITTDYIFCDRSSGRVWIPVGDTAKGAFTRVDGFTTGERGVRGKKRKVGPSAVPIGEGFAYIGNRATAEVCAVDDKTLEKKSCLKLPVPTDGVSFVAAMKEVWV